MDFEAYIMTIINEPIYSNPEMRNEFGEPFTLQEALLYGSIDEIQEILRGRFKVKLSAAQNDWEQRCREIVDVCLDRKICNNMPGSKYSSLLHFVIENLYEDFELVFLRCKGFDVNALVEYSCERYMSLLHVAIQKERTNVVKVLLKCGADVNVKDSYLQTPLFYAVRYEQNETAKMLLEAGAYINVEDDSELMPINIAFRGHHGHPCFNPNGGKLYHSDLIKLLCDYGAVLNFQNLNGTLSLFSACRKGNFSDVQFLINHGADLLSRDYNGRSAIHHAVYGNNYDLVDFLLRRGVDINAKDYSNKSCIHELAKTLDSIYVSEFHWEFISTVWDFDYEAKRLKESLDMLEFLVDNGAEFNTLDLSNLSPFMNSVYLNSFVEQFFELLKADVDNSRNLMYCLIDDILFDGQPEFHSNADYYADSTNAWVLLLAFLAMKECDIFKRCDANSFTVNERIHFEYVLSFFHQCKTEVNEMKRSICENRSVTFLDFLTKDLMEVLLFCRNGEIMTVLESYKHKEEFRLYKSFFDQRMERVQQLKNCENTFRRLIIDKCFNKKKLPLVVMDEIISYLRAADLRNFGRALCISKDFPNGNYHFMK